MKDIHGTKLICMRTSKVKWGLQRAEKETCFPLCVLLLDSPVCKTNSLRYTGKNVSKGILNIQLNSYYSLSTPITSLQSFPVVSLSTQLCIFTNLTQLQILKPVTPVSHLIEIGPTVIARGLKDTETGRSQKICILRKSGKQDLSGSGIWHKAEWLGLQSNWQCNKWEHLQAATIPKNSDLTSLACASGSALFCYQCSNSGHCHRHFGTRNPAC